jgi:hypothetical protein
VTVLTRRGAGGAGSWKRASDETLKSRFQKWNPATYFESLPCFCRKVGVPVTYNQNSVDNVTMKPDNVRL